MKLREFKGQQGRASGRLSRWTLGVASAMTLAVFGVVAPSSADAQSPRVHTGESPDYHVIRDGDTIWDLSGAYFGDSYQWPRLWSYNPHITNPHWIYPGDILYLKQVAQRAQQDEGTREQRGAASAGQNGQQPPPMGLYLPLGGMITPEEVSSVGRIIGSPKSARMLAQHDTVWLGFGDEAYREDERAQMRDDEFTEMEATEVNEGDRFAIVRLLEHLEDTRENGGEPRHGYKYVVLGNVVITEVSEREGVAHTAMIEQSWREIQRGDLLVPMERQLKLIQPRQADQDLVAHIFDSLDPGFAFGTHQYVFIDRGAEDGVRPGNRFFIFQRWEGLDRPGAETPKEIPWQRVGQVLVIDVRERHSMAVITRANREIIVGDRLEMYTGH